MIHLPHPLSGSGICRLVVDKNELRANAKDEMRKMRWGISKLGEKM